MELRLGHRLRAAGVGQAVEIGGRGRHGPMLRFPRSEVSAHPQRPPEPNEEAYGRRTSRPRARKDRLPMSTILVTGASGFVGSHAVPALLDAGHRVVALVRTPSAGEAVLGDASTPPSGRTSSCGPATSPGRSRCPTALDGRRRRPPPRRHPARPPRRRGPAPRQHRGDARRRRGDAGGRRPAPRPHGRDGRPGRPEPALRELQGQGGGPRRRLRPGLDDPQAVAPVRGGRRVLQHHRGPRPDVARHRPGARATARAGSSRSTSATSRGSPWPRSRTRRRSARRSSWAGRATGRTGRSRRRSLARARQEARHPADAGRRSSASSPATSEIVRLPFPVATDQLRQLKLDNIGALDVIPARFGFEAAPDGGPARATSAEAARPGASGGRMTRTASPRLGRRRLAARGRRDRAGGGGARDRHGRTTGRRAARSELTERGDAIVTPALDAVEADLQRSPRRRPLGVAVARRAGRPQRQRPRDGRGGHRPAATRS